MSQLDHRSLLVTAYAGFNSRAIDAVLNTMHPNVDWPNGWEGGRVIGHEAVKAYWLRQWQVVNPHVEPLRCYTDEQNRVVVDVHQVIKDNDGNLLADQILQHIYQIEDGLIRRMDIHALD